MTDRQLHAALDTIPGLVWLAGVDGAAEYLNRRWLDYSGLSQTQAIGWGWTAAVHPDDVDQLTDVWRRVLKAAFAGKPKRDCAGSMANIGGFFLPPSLSTMSRAL
jgi:PAS domain S-box-containing protein